MIRVGIVDDERLARVALRKLLSAHPDVEIVGEADSIASTQALLEQEAPDLIFLDVQLSGETGFELFGSTRVDAKVVFVTAFDHYALRAFEVNALDYLAPRRGEHEVHARSRDRLHQRS